MAAQADVGLQQLRRYPQTATRSPWLDGTVMPGYAVDSHNQEREAERPRIQLIIIPGGLHRPGEQ